MENAVQPHSKGLQWVSFAIHRIRNHNRISIFDVSKTSMQIIVQTTQTSPRTCGSRAHNTQTIATTTTTAPRTEPISSTVQKQNKQKHVNNCAAEAYWAHTSRA